MIMDLWESFRFSYLLIVIAIYTFWFLNDMNDVTSIRFYIQQMVWNLMGKELDEIGEFESRLVLYLLLR